MSGLDLKDDLLEIDRLEQDGSVTLSLRGEIDLSSAPLLREALEDAERSSAARIELDLRALDFIDSSGIHALLEAQDRARCNAHSLVLTHVSSQVRQLLRLMGLESLLSIE